MGMELLKLDDQRELANRFLYRLATDFDTSVPTILEQLGTDEVRMQALLVSQGLEENFKTTREQVAMFRSDDTLVSWFASVKFPKPEVMNKFITVCRAYSVGDLTLEEISLSIWDTNYGPRARSKMSDIVRKYPALKPMWESSKQLNRQNKVEHLAEQRRRLVEKSLAALENSLEKRVKTKITKKEGDVVVGNQKHKVNNTTVTREEVLPDLAAAKMVLDMTGLSKKEVQVTHKFEVIQEVEEIDITAFQEEQKKVLEELQRKRRLSNETTQEDE